MSQSSNDANIPDSNSQNSQSDTDELQKPMKKLGKSRHFLRIIFYIFDIFLFRSKIGNQKKDRKYEKRSKI